MNYNDLSNLKMVMFHFATSILRRGFFGDDLYYATNFW
jgi:hypothetical protein